MHRKTLLLIVGGFIILLWIGWFALHFPAMKVFAKLRDTELPVFSSHPIGDDAREFLETVRKKWNIQSREEPDSIFAEISLVTGLDESVEGVVAFHTYQVPEFSFFDHRRNKNAAVMATAQAVALPISVDGRIYVGDGFCFIKLTDELVELMEDGADGLSRTLYSKPKAGETGGGDRPPADPVRQRNEKPNGSERTSIDTPKTKVS